MVVIPQFVPQCDDIVIEVYDELLHLANIEVVASLNVDYYNRCQSLDRSKRAIINLQALRTSAPGFPHWQ